MNKNLLMMVGKNNKKIIPDNVSDAMVYRHSSNKGSVIECPYFNNQTLKLFVGDAPYRGIDYWNAPFHPTELQYFGSLNTSNNWLIKANATVQEYALTEGNPPPTTTIAEVLNSWQNLSTDNSAKINTDIWMQYKDQYSLPVIKHCRNQLTDLFEDGADLPNVFELMVIFLCSNAIDSLDPTVNSYLPMALGNILNSSKIAFGFNNCLYAFSSTDEAPTSVRGVGTIGRDHIYGSAGGASSDTRSKGTTFKGGIIPVKELKIA